MDNKELSALKALAEASKVQHVAYAEDGNLHWITGRKINKCELYATEIPPASILSLISRVESSDLLCEHYEMLCQSKDARIAELESQQLAGAAKGGNTSVDLSGLKRYAASDYITRIGEMVESDDGEYVKFADIQAILATPARDVGGLTDA